MATYNGEKYLRAQLDSIAKQTLLPDELVICDDGSTDGTMDIAEDFARLAPFPVRVERNPDNLGYARNFEKAANLCTGYIVFFCDQDDIWLEDKIAVTCAAIASDPDTMVVIVDALIVDALLNQSNETELQNIRAIGRDQNTFVMGCASAHRTIWRNTLGPIPSDFPHDFWLNHIAAVAGVGTFIATPKMLYRRHGGNASNSTTSQPGGGHLVDLWRGHGFADARPGWLRICNVYETAIDRIEAAAAVGRFDPEIARKAIAGLRWWLTAYQRRISATSLPRWRRVPSVFSMLLAGQYRPFLGWKSAAKDLIRP